MASTVESCMGLITLNERNLNSMIEALGLPAVANTGKGHKSVLANYLTANIELYGKNVGRAAMDGGLMHAKKNKDIEDLFKHAEPPLLDDYTKKELKAVLTFGMMKIRNFDRLSRGKIADLVQKSWDALYVNYQNKQGEAAASSSEEESAQGDEEEEESGQEESVQEDDQEDDSTSNEQEGSAEEVSKEVPKESEVKIYIMDESIDISRALQPKEGGKKVNVKAKVLAGEGFDVISMSFTYVFATEVADLIAEVVAYTGLDAIDFYMVYHSKVMESYRRVGDYLDQSEDKDVWLVVRVRGGGDGRPKRSRAADEDSGDELSQLLFIPTAKDGDIPLFTEILKLTEFDLQKWILDMPLSDLEKLSAITQTTGKTGNVNKLLKPHMQLVHNFMALKDP